EETFRMRLAPPRERKSRTKRTSAATAAVNEADRELYDALRALRLRLATEAGLPPYVICHDKTLAELAAKRPANEDDLHGITGLGARKIERYGKAFLETIAHLKPHPTLDNRLSSTVTRSLALHRQ